MSFAEVIFQMSQLQKLLVTILFSTRVRLFKAMDPHQVSLQIELQSKLLCTAWLGAGMRRFFVVHNINVHSQITPARELLQALATLMRLFNAVDLHHVSLQSELQSKVLCTSWLGAGMGPFFVVHNFNVPRQHVAFTKLHQALVTLIWLFVVMHTIDVFCQCALSTELLQTLVTLIWLFFVVHIFYVSRQFALATELLQTLATARVFFHVQGELLSLLHLGNIHLGILVNLPRVLPVCVQR